MTTSTLNAQAAKPDLPLVGTRTINLDTDEGSWISLDVSPDGRTIVFDLLGDLYTLGSIEAGKLADFVVLDRNPLENIRNTNSVRMVMKNGRLYDGNTLDEPSPRQRKAEAVPGTPMAPRTGAGIRQ